MAKMIFITSIGLLLTKTLSLNAAECTEELTSSTSFSGSVRFTGNRFEFDNKQKVEEYMKEAMKKIVGTDVELIMNINEGVLPVCSPSVTSKESITTTTSSESITTTTTQSTPPLETTSIKSSETTSTTQATTAATTEGSTTEPETTRTKTTSTSQATTSTITTAGTTEGSTTEAQTTKIVATQPVRHSGKIYSNCSSKYSAPYFWVSGRRKKRNMTFAEGRMICDKCGSVPAELPDEKTSEEIVSAIRKVYENKGTQRYWVGMTYDPETRMVSPSYSYFKWGGNAPYTRSPSDGRSRQNIFIMTSTSGVYMSNDKPDTTTKGIVCWKGKPDHP